MYLKTSRTTWSSGLSLKYLIYKGVVPVVGVHWAATKAMAVAEATAWRITQMVPASHSWMSSRLTVVGFENLLVEFGEGELVRFMSWLLQVTVMGYGSALVVKFNTAVRVLVNDTLYVSVLDTAKRSVKSYVPVQLDRVGSVRR